ncbi:tripartite tricarboxylate transporter substrate-binding protein [Bosea psychrotolerans]|uniref:Tripartite-type tricarboxylate transporter receptor subunit TctC n=1 Tax=Bosea psychrotolerans TaxID=1871628 RepID=A0A2S4M8A7_9HYPH|nr:tripartite tricarboxylate transporter substrate-binding protein [Bosea psychrotolerans]POR50972.1 tripartite-type tricarboxylate transporter receptor subunit TctC [Bosea psychrotolerans]
MLRPFKALIALAALLAPAAASAQTYPTRPVTMIVPFAPGGTTDILARIVAETMGRELGQNVLVENVGGAGGRTGTERVVKAQADGYIILFGNMGPMAASKALFKDQRYDPRSDLAPIGLVSDVPMVLAASKASGVTDLKGLLARMREKGEAVTFGTAGYGATSDMAPNLLLHQTKLKATIVPYQGAGPAIRDLTGGFVDAVIDQTVTMLPIHQGGLVTALAVSGPRRIPQAPDLPTFTEAGLPEFGMTVWNAISVPKATPGPVIDRLIAALDATFETASVQKRFEELAVPIPPREERGPAALQKLVDAEVARWAEIFKDGAAKP